MDLASILKVNPTQRKQFNFRAAEFTLRLGQTTKIMGILNATDDSFSHDGIYKQPKLAKEVALQMSEQGAGIIDIGGESTRPGAEPVSVEEEKARVVPLIKELIKEIKVPISVDTTKSEVARAALGAGASIINDISGLSFDRKMAKVIREFGAGCILMHIKGTPQTMQRNPVYESLIEEIIERLKERVAAAIAAGIDQNNIVIDPGIGFGKITEHNLRIIKQLKDFACLNFPVLVGVSRKSFIGNVLNLDVGQRLLGGVACCVISILNGAHIVRVHDVQAISQVVRMVDAVLNS
ncbi:dihydropteroate synthase [Candidatus Omnitrophota bacterium]